MNTYQVIVGSKGEIIMPAELRELLGLLEGDMFELRVDLDGKIYTRGAERSAGPLIDFFEDLILSDLHCEGYSGDSLKENLYLQKIRLSTALDSLAEEARTRRDKGKLVEWRTLSELEGLSTLPRGEYKVIISTRAEGDLSRLPKSLRSEVADIFHMMEQDPSGFKRLRGPFYATYRVAFNGKMPGQNRIIYTVMEDSKTVSVISIGERKVIYNWLKGLA